MLDRLVQMFFWNAVRDTTSPGVVDEREARDLVKVAQRSVASTETLRDIYERNPEYFSADAVRVITPLLGLAKPASPTNPTLGA